MSNSEPTTPQSASTHLEQVRQAIQATDEALLELLARRRQLTIEVAQTKASTGIAVRDQRREADLLLRLLERGQELGLAPDYLHQLYQLIIEDSVLLQQAWLQQESTQPAIRVAHLGQTGTYSHLAAHAYASRRQAQLDSCACDSFREVVRLTEQGQAEVGLLPIENSTSGSVNEVYDLLRRTRLHIVGESYLPIDHHLLAPAGVELSQVREVLGHPQALSQCSEFLQQHPQLKAIPCASSAHAMASVAGSERQELAALGSRSGGTFYNLCSLASNLADQAENYTRFITLARQAVQVPQQIPAKISILLVTHNQPGALADALQVLRQQQLDMTRLESRPMPGNPWEELFYIDLRAHREDSAWQQALAELQGSCQMVKVLGCYPDEHFQPTRLP